MKRKNAKRLKKTKKSRNARGYYVTNKYNKSVLPLFVIKVTPYSLTKFSMSNTLGIKSRSNLTIANFSMKSTHSCHTSGAVTSAKSILSKYNLTDSSCPAFEFFKTTNTRTRILQLTLSKLVLSKINNTKV